jgi:hypothetical protein
MVEKATSKLLYPLAILVVLGLCSMGRTQAANPSGNPSNCNYNGVCEKGESDQCSDCRQQKPELATDHPSSGESDVSSRLGERLHALRVELAESVPEQARTPAEPADAHIESAGSIELVATGDTTIVSGLPDANRGYLDTLYIGFAIQYNLGKLRSLIKFDLSEIPHDARITKGRLKLYCELATLESSSMSVTAYRINGYWTEMGATWNNASYKSAEAYDTTTIPYWLDCMGEYYFDNGTFYGGAFDVAL